MKFYKKYKSTPPYNMSACNFVKSKRKPWVLKENACLWHFDLDCVSLTDRLLDLNQGSV